MPARRLRRGRCVCPCMCRVAPDRRRPSTPRRAGTSATLRVIDRTPVLVWRSQIPKSEAPEVRRTGNGSSANGSARPVRIRLQIRDQRARSVGDIKPLLSRFPKGGQGPGRTEEDVAETPVRAAGRGPRSRAASVPQPVWTSISRSLPVSGIFVHAALRAWDAWKPTIVSKQCTASSAETGKGVPLSR